MASTTIHNVEEYCYRGGAIPLDSLRYVVRQADHDLDQAIEAGHYCYILNSRQMGKSSLIARALDRLDATRYTGTVIDLTLLGSSAATEFQWYGALARKISRGLHIRGIDARSWWGNRREENGAQRFNEFLEEIVLKRDGRRIVIFLDEIDRVLGQELLDTDHFFALIRSFYNARLQNPDYNRLSFVPVGVVAPNDLIRNPQTTPFNVGTAIKLYGFTESEAQAVLADGLTHYADDANVVLCEILSWTGGQPFLTQKLCQLVLDAESRIAAGSESAAVAELVRSSIIDRWELQDNPVHLIDIRTRILESPNKRTVHLLSLYRDMLGGGSAPLDDTPEQLELRLTGLATERDGRLQVFNRIYSTIFDEAWATSQLTVLRPFGAPLVPRSTASSGLVSERRSSSYTSGSFYIAGGTLPTDARSYVVRRADYSLLESLTQGEFCYVFNTRQMGKSSLMIRTASILREQGFVVVVVDLSAIGQNLAPIQWYAGMLNALAKQVGKEDELEAFWVAHAELGPLQRFMTAVRQIVLSSVSASLVVFVDEVDAVLSLPFAANEFFGAIRECYNRRSTDPAYEKLTFCLLGVATPADLISDIHMNPFNIGRHIELTDFTSSEAAPLALGIAGALPILQRVLYWTNGHPYMTQRLCRAVAEERDVATPRQVDTICERLFLSKRAYDTDDNLAFVRSRLLHSEVDLAALLHLYQQVQSGKEVKDDDTSPLVPVLRLCGVVGVQGGLLTERNRIYDHVFDRDWILSHLPDAELRRLREAYRRGVLRTIVIGAIVLLAMAFLTAETMRERARLAVATRTSDLSEIALRITSEPDLIRADPSEVERAFTPDATIHDAGSLMEPGNTWSAADGGVVRRYRYFQAGDYIYRQTQINMDVRGITAYATSVVEQRGIAKGGHWQEPVPNRSAAIWKLTKVSGVWRISQLYYDVPDNEEAAVLNEMEHGSGPSRTGS